MTFLLETERLILRSWRPEDKAPLAALDGDPEVMRYYPEPLSPEKSAEQMQRMQQRIDANGYGLWAAELKSTGECVGMIGLNEPDYDLPCGPCTEVGWRLAKHVWGQGLAPEGAWAALDFGFRELGRDEIFAFTSVVNQPSRRVMEKLGMQYQTGADFPHPKVPAGHELSQHVLYKITGDEFGLVSFD